MATTRTKAAPAAEEKVELVENPTQITEAPADAGDVAIEDQLGAGTFEDPSWPADPEHVYPTNEAGVPDSSLPLYPGDDVEFLMAFLEHLAPEQFDRAKQRFMQAANEERAA